MPKQFQKWQAVILIAERAHRLQLLDFAKLHAKQHAQQYAQDFAKLLIQVRHVFQIVRVGVCQKCKQDAIIFVLLDAAVFAKFVVNLAAEAAVVKKIASVFAKRQPVKLRQDKGVRALWLVHHVK